ncbi:o-succinylbenzoate synthase [Algoriphagus sp. H41]|uniref:O-succinylbenzoate synthase n=1 Tax=Algoriphagus oliviformis TaxID=2811231 RepID=A0ABS3CAZ4_9BACT|nr:o-succinylbenzoate synthase [Algoriphagus oliviformis]MBN7812799.1 o-succinylbenzoate synthase [Algoriphagus oliviformis]
MPASATLRFSHIRRTLDFRFDAGTSRGVLKTRDVYWIKAFDPQNPSVMGWGEAAPLVKLSIDHREDFEELLVKILDALSGMSFVLEEPEILEEVKMLVPPELPSIRFGLETALLDLAGGGKKRLFPNPFFDRQAGISINGLIWMGDREFMLEQIEQKLAEGFDCIKMKIGAIDFQQEIALLQYIRSRFSKEQIVLRVDANGAFTPQEARGKLERLAALDIHSIEQPIRAGQWKEMNILCKSTPLPIALDEELIGVEEKKALLDSIRPQHIILKPTLLGGILETQEWVRLAEERGIGWWMTSALESNIGLNAISQLASALDTRIPQGLGTGKLYHNNLASPLEIKAGKIFYNPEIGWEEPV